MSDPGGGRKPTLRENAAGAARRQKPEQGKNKKAYQGHAGDTEIKTVRASAGGARPRPEHFLAPAPAAENRAGAANAARAARRQKQGPPSRARRGSRKTKVARSARPAAGATRAETGTPQKWLTSESTKGKKTSTSLKNNPSPAERLRPPRSSQSGVPPMFLQQTRSCKIPYCFGVPPVCPRPRG